MPALAKYTFFAPKCHSVQVIAMNNTLPVQSYSGGFV